MLTIVYDNNPGSKELIPAWGFACVVDGLSQTILFDTGGRGGVLLDNMNELDAKQQDIDAVVLSHIHGDHTGGLKDFLEENNDVTVFLPAVFPEDFKSSVRSAGATMIEVDSSEQICPGAHTTGVLDGGIKEQGLYVETGDGIVVITGCAHPGILRLTEAAKENAQMPVFAVLGGFHMGGASAREISRVIKGLQALGVRRVGPCHCSGDKTRKMMKEAFGENYMELAVGTRLTFAKRRVQRGDE